MPQEYQRQCQSCGKVWHSLVKREKEIAASSRQGGIDQCAGATQTLSSCGMCGTGVRQRGQLAQDATKAELDRLRQCPQCGSASFNERIVDHAKQPQLRR
jgi:uncharacterized Zn finger protein